MNVLWRVIYYLLLPLSLSFYNIRFANFFIIVFKYCSLYIVIKFRDIKEKNKKPPRNSVEMMNTFSVAHGCPRTKAKPPYSLYLQLKYGLHTCILMST